MRLEAECRRDSAHLPLIAVTGYRSHAVRRVEINGYFVLFGHPILFAYFVVKTKTNNFIISHTVQL